MGQKYPRFLVVGGRCGFGYVNPIELRRLYQLDKWDCNTTAEEIVNGPTHNGVILSEVTILRPQPTFKSYRKPQVILPLTENVVAMMWRFITNDYTDESLWPIFADMLDDTGYNDPKFPWLLNAMRHSDPYRHPPSWLFRDTQTMLRVRKIDEVLDESITKREDL